MKKILFITFLLAFLIACSDPKKASNSNFKSVIEAHFSNEARCLKLNMEFPETLKESSNFAFLNSGFQRKIEALKALESDGFATINEASKTVEAGFGRKKDVKTYTVDLTDKATGVFDKKLKDFCYGKYHVTEIVNFTEPADFFGKVISEVKYKYQISEIPKWVQSSQAVNELPIVKFDMSTLNEPKEKEMVLVLTNNGWEHE